MDWRPWFEVWLPTALLAGSALLAFPGIDPAVSRLFGDPATGFPLGGTGAIGGLRMMLLAATGGIMLATAGAALAGVASSRLRPHVLRDAVFALSTFALGPGLLVNGVLKRVSGRVRPMNVEAFGGPYPFQPAFDFSGPCGSGCSFVSAETAAVATAMMCLVLVVGPKIGDRARVRLRIAAASSILAVAGIRIALGAHFLSDVVCSLLLITALVPALHILFGIGRVSKRMQPADRKAEWGRA
jgi:membrane-associated phospholipid phosphatase